VLRSLSYHRRAHLALALAVAVATAVLAGALGGGRLGAREPARAGAVAARARRAVVVAERAFRDRLAADWSREGGGTTAAALVARASARHGESGSRAPGVTVLGVDAAWEALFPSARLDFARREAQPFPSVLLADPLARELGADVGDTVDLLLPAYSTIPRETLVGREEARETVATLRLTVAGLLPERGLGGFRLDTRQAAPLNAVVERSRLARAIGARARANLLVARGEADVGSMGTPSARAKAEAALGRAVTLADLGLKLSTRESEVIVESEQLVLDDALVQRLAASARESGAAATTVFTYLANRMRVGDREVPYSTVAALGPGATLLNVDGAPTRPLGPGEIALKLVGCGTARRRARYASRARLLRRRSARRARRAIGDVPRRLGGGHARSRRRPQPDASVARALGRRANGRVGPAVPGRPVAYPPGRRGVLARASCVTEGVRHARRRAAALAQPLRRRLLAASQTARGRELRRARAHAGGDAAASDRPRGRRPRSPRGARRGARGG
jgi:hypothetical protein